MSQIKYRPISKTENEFDQDKDDFERNPVNLTFEEIQILRTFEQLSFLGLLKFGILVIVDVIKKP